MFNECKAGYNKDMVENARTPAKLPLLTAAPNDDSIEEERQARSLTESSYRVLCRNLKHIQASFDTIFDGLAESSMGPANRETSIITHADLSANNILIDPETKAITGIIDWENVSTMPLGIACELPKLLDPDTKPRYEEPDPKKFGGYNPDIDDEYGGKLNGKNDRYVEAILEYEHTQLRSFFLKEMRKACPAWVEEHLKGQELRDAAHVIAIADDVWSAESVSEWLGYFDDGEKKSMAWIEWGHELEEEEANYGAGSEQEEPRRREKLALPKEHEALSGQKDQAEIPAEGHNGTPIDQAVSQLPESGTDRHISTEAARRGLLLTFQDHIAELLASFWERLIRPLIRALRN